MWAMGSPPSVAHNFIYGDEYMQTDKELKNDLLLFLMRTTEAGKHRQFRLLENWQEYIKAKQVKRAEAVIVASLQESANKLFKKYCNAIKSGETDVIKLLAYCTTKEVISFYEEETNVISDMIYEYEAYLMEGNFLWAWLFNEQRPADKLWDHRGL